MLQTDNLRMALHDFLMLTTVVLRQQAVLLHDGMLLGKQGLYVPLQSIQLLH